MSKKNRIKNQGSAAAVNGLDTAGVFDFMSKKKLFFIISGCLIFIALLATLIFGVEVAIEFKGGTVLNYSYTGDLDTSKADKAVEKVIGGAVKIQKGDALGDDAGTQTISVSYTKEIVLSDEIKENVFKTLTETYPDNAITDLDDSSSISASSGKEFFLKCMVAVIFAILLLVIYIALRFKRISGWSAGVCAIIALLHDSIVVYGAFIIFGFEIDANFMAVVLTILGYSVNSTIVIYDRIRENRRNAPKASVEELVNVSVSQSKRRTIRTTITTVSAMTVVCICAFIAGLDSIISFAFPLIIGMIAGAYSSLCLAPSLWVAWQTRNSGAKTEAAVAE